MDELLDKMESRLQNLEKEAAPKAPKTSARSEQPTSTPASKAVAFAHTSGPTRSGSHHHLKRRHWHSVGDITPQTILTTEDSDEDEPNVRKGNPQEETNDNATSDNDPARTPTPLRKKDMAVDILEELGTT